MFHQDKVYSMFSLSIFSLIYLAYKATCDIFGKLIASNIWTTQFIWKRTEPDNHGFNFSVGDVFFLFYIL